MAEVVQDVVEMQISDFFDMSLMSKVDWVMKQPIEIKKRFLRWKSMKEIKDLSEERERKIFSHLFESMPKGTILSILYEFPENNSFQSSR